MDGDFVALTFCVANEHIPAPVGVGGRFQAKHPKHRWRAWFCLVPSLCLAWFENLMTKLVLQKKLKSDGKFAARCAELGHVQFRFAPSWHHVAFHGPYATRSAA